MSLQICTDGRSMAHNDSSLFIGKVSKDFVQALLHSLTNLVEGFAVRTLKGTIFVLPKPAIAKLRRFRARSSLCQTNIHRHWQTGMLRCLNRPQQRRCISYFCCTQLGQFHTCRSHFVPFG